MFSETILKDIPKKEELDLILTMILCICTKRITFHVSKTVTSMPGGDIDSGETFPTRQGSLMLCLKKLMNQGINN